MDSLGFQQIKNVCRYHQAMLQALEVLMVCGHWQSFVSEAAVSDIKHPEELLGHLALSSIDPFSLSLSSSKLLCNSNKSSIHPPICQQQCHTLQANDAREDGQTAHASCDIFCNITQFRIL